MAFYLASFATLLTLSITMQRGKVTIEEAQIVIQYVGS